MLATLAERVVHRFLEWNVGEQCGLPVSRKSPPEWRVGIPIYSEVVQTNKFEVVFSNVRLHVCNGSCVGLKSDSQGALHTRTAYRPSSLCAL